MAEQPPTSKLLEVPRHFLELQQVSFIMGDPHSFLPPPIHDFQHPSLLSDLSWMVIISPVALDHVTPVLVAPNPSPFKGIVLALAQNRFLPTTSHCQHENIWNIAMGQYQPSKKWNGQVNIPTKTSLVQDVTLWWINSILVVCPTSGAYQDRDRRCPPAAPNKD